MNRSFYGRVVSFFAGPTLAGLATVSVILYEKEEYFHSTSHYSSSRETSALWQSCGKPSTKFPHRGLVEWLFIKIKFSKNKEKHNKIKDSKQTENLHFGEISKI